MDDEKPNPFYKQYQLTKEAKLFMFRLLLEGC
jgi:hypothetical protein